MHGSSASLATRATASARPGIFGRRPTSAPAAKTPWPGSSRRRSRPWSTASRPLSPVHEAMPSDCRIFTYERLLEAPEDITAGLCRFLGVSDDPALVRACVEGAAFACRHRRPPARRDERRCLPPQGRCRRLGRDHAARACRTDRRQARLGLRLVRLDSVSATPTPCDRTPGRAVSRNAPASPFAAREVLLGEQGAARPRAAAQPARAPGCCRHARRDGEPRPRPRPRAGLLRRPHPPDPGGARALGGHAVGRADGQPLQRPRP